MEVALVTAGEDMRPEVPLKLAEVNLHADRTESATSLMVCRYQFDTRKLYADSDANPFVFASYFCEKTKQRGYTTYRNH